MNTIYYRRIPAGMRKKENGLFEKRFTVDGKRYSVYGHSVKECMDNETELREKIKAGLYQGANYAQTECPFRYCGTAIPFLTVRSTAR